MQYASVLTGEGTAGCHTFASYRRWERIPPGDPTHLPDGLQPRFAAEIVSRVIICDGHHSVLLLEPFDSGSGALSSNLDIAHPFPERSSFLTGLISWPCNLVVTFVLLKRQRAFPIATQSACVPLAKSSSISRSFSLFADMDR